MEDPASWRWGEALIGEVGRTLDVDPYWREKLQIEGRPRGDGSLGGVHLGVFKEPFLAWVLDGSKTVESRFSVHRQAPYGAVGAGDVLFLKRSAGPIVGIAEIGCVWDYRLDATAWSEIKLRFGSALRIEDPLFWKVKASACYATLMKLERVTRFDDVFCGKRDRRGWVILTARKKKIDCRDGTR